MPIATLIAVLWVLAGVALLFAGARLPHVQWLFGAAAGLFFAIAMVTIRKARRRQ